jgi:signal transduction histidine kinase
MSVSTLLFQQRRAPHSEAELESLLAVDSLQLDGRESDGARQAATKDECSRDAPEKPVTFEALLADLTSRFVNLPVHEIDDQIEQGLQTLGKFLGIDRSSFAEFTADKRNLLVTHCFVAPGMAPFPKIVVDGQLPWYVEQVRDGQMIRYARLPDELPAEAVAERAYCVQHGLKSHLAIPLIVGESMNCLLTFATFHDYRDWPDELVQRLWLIGEVFANSVARKRAEETAQQLRDQLARMVRVSLVGELAAAIAHEITQPLCAIVSNSQAGQRLLAGENIDLDEVRDTLRDIAADGRRASDVVTRIRGMLQKQTPERSPFHLPDAMREVVALIYGPAMQHGISVQHELDSDLPDVLGDRVQLQQVVLNLAVNAVDAMSRHDGATRQLSLGARRDGQGVLVWVCDTGPGIAPENRESIFDAFFTTKPTGLGVGLAISKSIVESHGGRLWVDSEPGRGAAFHFTVPAAQELIA